MTDGPTEEGENMKFKVWFVTAIRYRQFTGVVEANTITEAEKKARQIFLSENPECSAHYQLVSIAPAPKY